MLRKAIFVCAVLALAVNPGVLARQNDDEIEKHRRQQGFGLLMLCGGVSVGVVGAMLMVGANMSFMSGGETDESLMVEGYVFAAGGAVVFVAGILVASLATGAIRKLERRQRDTVSLEVHGPRTAGGDSLGDISIVVRY